MATYQLRPMSVGEILDGSLALLRRNAALFFSLSVACLGVPTVIELYTEFGGTSGPLSGLSLLGNLLRAIGYLLLSGASVYAVSELYLGRTPRVGEALRFATPKMGRLFVSGFAGTIVIFFAALLLVIPGIIVACGYAVAVQAVVLEDLPSGTEALARSWSLTKGFKGKAFVLGCVMIALFLLVFAGAAFVVGITAAVYKPLFLPGLILFMVVILMFYPFSSCVLTLFYYDLRVRREAFDLELLNRHLGTVPGPV